MDVIWSRWVEERWGTPPVPEYAGRESCRAYSMTPINHLDPGRRGERHDIEFHRSSELSLQISEHPRHGVFQLPILIPPSPMKSDELVHQSRGDQPGKHGKKNLRVQVFIPNLGHYSIRSELSTCKTFHKCQVRTKTTPSKVAVRKHRPSRGHW